MSNADNLVARRADAAEITAKFQGLVQSPLRAAILRYMCARPEETFEVESLMQTFGRMRLDVENCVRELVQFGISKKIPGTTPTKYGLVQPDPGDVLHDLLDEFLERRATVSSEDRSPAVQRFREMIGREYLHSSCADIVLADHALHPADMIRMRVREDDRNNRLAGTVLVIEVHACFRGLDRCPCIGISCPSPEVRPRTAFELPEVLDFHNPLAAPAHELQTAVQVQNLYTIPAAFEDTAQKVVIVS